MNSRGLSKQELAFERTGNFSALIASIPRYGMKTNSRRLAALARAHAFSRDFEYTYGILRELRGQYKNLDDETRVVILLTESLLHRFSNRWEEANTTANEALALAKKHRRHELVADAEFALARTAVECGRLFLGSDLYQRISFDKRVSEYRRGLALSNWVWVLWDLGRTDEVKELLPLIPHSFRARHELCLTMLQGNLDLALKWIRDGLPGEINVDQRLYLCQSLIVACIVLGPSQPKPMSRTDAVKLSKDSWVCEQLLSMANSESVLDRVIVNGCLKLLGIKAPTAFSMNSSQNSEQNSWRVQLEADSFEFLSLIQEKPSSALSFYTKKINPTFAEQWWLKTPLIPRLNISEGGEASFASRSPWARALSDLLGLKQKKKSTETSVILLNSGKLIYKKDDVKKEIDLRKSMTSFRLLRILGHGNKTAFTKKELHQNLTTSSYLSEIHDARLWKLLNRLEKKLKTAGIPVPWYLPGNNTVILTQSIQIQ